MGHAEQDIYEEFADKYDRQGDARQRDLFLVLAADAAYTAGIADQADRLRRRLLELSPHHLLRPFASFADALHSSDIQDYLVNLRRQFPPAQLLASTGDPFPPATPREPSVLQQPPTYALQQPLPVAAKNSGPPRLFTPRKRDAVAVPYTKQKEEADTSGRWLTVSLFFLVLAGALALVVWTIIRPLW